MSQSLQFSNEKSLKKLENCRVRKRDWGRGLRGIGAKKKEPGGVVGKKIENISAFAESKKIVSLTSPSLSIVSKEKADY